MGKYNAKVIHPNELIERKRIIKDLSRSPWFALNDALLDWVTTHVLASIAMFDIALIVPLLILNAPDSIKITLGVVSGSWIQWWALPALQRSQNKTQAQADAKADADHATHTHIANQVDAILNRLTKPQPGATILKVEVPAKPVKLK